MSTINEQFNNIVMELFKTFKSLPSQKFKSKLYINDLQKRISSGMKIDEGYALDIMGPMIMTASKEIESSDANFFLSRRYDIDVRTLCAQHKVDYTLAMNTINFMKDAYVCAPSESQKQIFTLLKKLLIVKAKHDLSQIEEKA